MTETAYLHVYKLLAEAPDPAPLISVIESEMESVKDTLNAEKKLLVDEVASLNSELVDSRAHDLEYSALKQRLTTYEAKVYNGIIILKISNS